MRKIKLGLKKDDLIIEYKDNKIFLWEFKGWLFHKGRVFSFDNNEVTDILEGNAEPCDKQMTIYVLNKREKEYYKKLEHQFRMLDEL